MNVKFIELMSSDFKSYKVMKDNILTYNCIIKNAPVNCSKFENEELTNIPMVETLLLVVKDYNKIKDEEDNVFNTEKKDISQVLICDDNDVMQIGYVNLTTNNHNKKQINCVRNNRLYISIEENF
jgi:hypothetical protein